MKMVIIGANGVIGHALYTECARRFPDCTGLTTKVAPPLITTQHNFPSLRAYISGADCIAYCVGISKFAECEQFPEQSLFLNVQLPLEILQHLLARQKFIYLSSPVASYDFGAAPVPAYALHKRMAEEGIRQSGHENTLVIRPAKVIESAGIIRDWKIALSKNEKITAFADQSISPINTRILSDCILRLMEGNFSGSYNFSAGDKLSYLDLAKIICAYFKFDEKLVAAKTARTGNPFFFQQDILDCARAQEDIQYTPPFSQDIVKQYLRSIT